MKSNVVDLYIILFRDILKRKVNAPMKRRKAVAKAVGEVGLLLEHHTRGVLVYVTDPDPMDWGAIKALQ